MSKFALCFCVALVLILPVTSRAQEWVARYDGPASDWDLASGIAIDETGNVIVTGYSGNGSTARDYATVKYNSSGVEQWVARYNGPNDGNDYARAIAVDNAGYIYVTGFSKGLGTDWDYATVKYDSDGVEQWVARYNGPGDTADYAYAMVLDYAGNIYVTGSSYGAGTGMDYATVKYNSSGVLQWVARYNGLDNMDDEAFALAVDSSLNVYVTGGSQDSVTHYDYATVRYNSFGVEQWVALYNGSADFYDAARAIAIDNAGAIYVTGGIWNLDTQTDCATVKYDTLGNVQWATWYSGFDLGHDQAHAIAVDEAGTVYVTGSSYSLHGHDDFLTVNYDASGVEQWVAFYDGPNNGTDWANEIALDNAENIYVLGWCEVSATDFDYATVKYDTMGVEQWVNRYNGPTSGWDQAQAMVIDNAGNIYVSGGSEGLGTGVDYATIKYSPTGVRESTLEAEKQKQITATIVRGPLQLPEGKECEIFDVAGRTVEASKAQPGIYFIQINGAVVQKIIKIR